MRSIIADFLSEYWGYLIFKVIFTILIIYLWVAKDKLMTKTQKIWYSFMIFFFPYIGILLFYWKSVKMKRDEKYRIKRKDY